MTWQVLFLFLSTDPARYRLMMLPAFLEKATVAITIPWLYMRQRVAAPWLGAAIGDAIFGILFLIAFWRIGQQEEG
ncbi:MAG: hypothetical protein GY832_39150 [Chloroflexi bacterium]|nr:hypothetical protein [Chloroflexota bacterium]